MPTTRTEAIKGQIRFGRVLVSHGFPSNRYREQRPAQNQPPWPRLIGHLAKYPIPAPRLRRVPCRTSYVAGYGANLRVVSDINVILSEYFICCAIYEAVAIFPTLFQLVVRDLSWPENGPRSAKNSDGPGCPRYWYLSRLIPALGGETQKYLLNNFSIARPRS